MTAKSVITSLTSVRGWLLIKRQKVTNAGGEERKRNSCALRRQEITNAGLGVEEKETWYAVCWG